VHRNVNCISQLKLVLADAVCDDQLVKYVKMKVFVAYKNAYGGAVLRLALEVLPQRRRTRISLTSLLS
jgi:hypothetical protein